ncbi:glutamate receptor 2.8-like protein [Cinnamomum micranthum f. kanehirae]|uniref:Glutamate receptor n=1 Tax=Cinnamomum micranthum f. kanehirae TaxID=337451 RepID=A0A443NA24_9MAGN|nr:glutamate receptor 2.8-like protein [Cinnamomum micranthum f. kanehirae]
MKNTSKFSFSLILLYSLSLLTAGCCLAGAQNKSLSSSRTVFDIGVVLDLRTPLGKMSESCISMALTDFYTAHTSYTTQLKLHWRDSNQDSVNTASMALDLLNNVQVKAILGPQTFSQVQFIAELGTKANVPILSFSSTTSPLLSTIQTPYFIQTAVSDPSQVKAIAAVVKAFEWREVVQICEDNPNGNGVTPYLIDALQEVEARVPYRCVLSHLMTDDQIAKELYKMKTMQTRVFIVHLSPSLSSRLFLMANEIGMMSEGYAWIITYGLANLLDSMNSSVIQSMQGILGVKPYFPNSRELDNFTVRWKRKFFNENPNFDRVELNIFGMWAYDAVWALAKAVEKVQKTRLGVSAMGPKLRDAILKTNFNGLSGQFNLNNGQLQSSAFEIVNVIGKGDRVVGFWTPIQGLNKKLNASKKTFSNSKDDLSPIIWPGDSTSVPKGWVIPTSGKKLKIGVPKMNGFPEFVNQVLDPETNQTKFEGYSIDVFQAAVERLPYAIECEFFVFEDGDGKPKGSYNDLIDQVYFKNYDAVVGDVTIIANRTHFVDFTLPYTESGVMMLVLAKEDKGKAWIFLKPLRLDLWLMTGFFFLFTGFVVWALEHRVNDEFRGPPHHQIGVMLWFSLSTLVFAHSSVLISLQFPYIFIKSWERLVHSRSKFVVIVWVFVVWILSSSYTASLTSLLTIQRLQPTISKVDDLVKNGDNVGYMLGSYVFDLLKSFKVEESKLKPYTSAEEYAEALSNGTVGAIVDEIPYIRLFLAKNGNCEKYKMVFPKGSPLVPELSREILYVTEHGIMDINQAQWVGQQTTCGDKPTTAESNSLTLDSFWGLFLITGATSCLALFNYLLSFLYAHRHVLFTRNSDIPFHKRLIAIIRHLDERDLSHHSFIRRARVSSGSLELVSRHRGNSPPTDASVEQEPTSSNPTRRDWVVVTEVEDDTQHFQTINCAPLGGICSTERGGLEPDTPAPASTNIKAEIDLVDAERN